MSSVTTLDEFVTSVRRQLHANYDVLALITGKPGSGKSNLANFLARKVDPTFSIPERTFFSGKSLIWGSERAPRYSAVVWDEIVEGGLAIEAITSENRDVLKHLITGRSLNLFTVACAPKLKLFQAFTKEDRAEWWIHLPRRGEAVFHRVANENPYPGAKTYYPQQFVLTGDFTMPRAQLELYETLKREWRTKWHRSSDAFLSALSARETEDQAVHRLARALSWLPGAVREYEDAFPGHRGLLKPWEKKLQARILANRKARGGSA
jgi:hypothetical protein